MKNISKSLYLLTNKLNNNAQTLNIPTRNRYILYHPNDQSGEEKCNSSNMKKVLIVLFFVLSTLNFGGSSYTTHDLQNYTDRREVLVMELHDAYTQANFERIPVFCNTRVQYITKKDSGQPTYKILTQQELISKLSFITTVLPYKRFQIWTWQNSQIDGVVSVRIFKFEKIDDPYVTFNYVLEEDSWIKQVIVETP